MKISIRRFLGDREHDFALTDDMILELERLAGVGIGALYRRAVAMQFNATDISETIRLGLIGGGTPPQEAARLAETWAKNRPYAETYPIALDILDGRWNGVEPQKETHE